MNCCRSDDLNNNKLKLKNNKLKLNKVKQRNRIKKSITAMVVLGIIIGTLVYVPINVKTKNLMAAEEVAKAKFDENQKALEKFNKLKETSKSLYGEEATTLEINNKIESCLLELKNGVNETFKKLVDELEELVDGVSEGNHSDLEVLFSKINEDKLIGFSNEEIEKVNTLIEEYNNLIEQQNYSEAKSILDTISSYIDNVKKEVEIRSTKEIYDKKSSESASNVEPTYINGILLVNKRHGLPDSFGSGENPEAKAAFEEMKSAASREGIYINAFSTYRSYFEQSNLYWNYVSRYGQDSTDTFSARAGFSEHQTGLGFDIGGSDRSLWSEQDFQYTVEAKWLAENCYKYGFILRYPQGKEWKTGFIYESWHFRYIGKEHSKNFNNNNLTLEEYLEQ